MEETYLILFNKPLDCCLLEKQVTVGFWFVLRLLDREMIIYNSLRYCSCDLCTASFGVLGKHGFKVILPAPLVIGFLGHTTMNKYLTKKD